MTSSKTPIDFLAADGHKWLLGPEGAGLFYVSRDWIERLRPLGVGWHSVNASYNVPGIHFDLKKSAQRWEGGTFNMPGLQAFGASVGLLLELGPQVVSDRILAQAESVREIARRHGWSIVGSTRAGDLSGIVALERPGLDPDAFAATFALGASPSPAAVAGSASVLTCTTTPMTSTGSPKPSQRPREQA